MVGLLLLVFVGISTGRTLSRRGIEKCKLTCESSDVYLARQKILAVLEKVPPSKGGMAGRMLHDGHRKLQSI
jgi:hypothetical protein